MNANLLTLAQEAMGGDFSKLAGQFLGETPGATQSAMTSLLPAVLGVIAQKGATAGGASSLMSLISGANLDVSSLGNIAGLFGAGGAGINGLLKAGTSSLVPALFGDKSGALICVLGQVLWRPCALTFGLKLGKTLGEGAGHGSGASYG